MPGKINTYKFYYINCFSYVWSAILVHRRCRLSNKNLEAARDENPNPSASVSTDIAVPPFFVLVRHIPLRRLRLIEKFSESKIVLQNANGLVCLVTKNYCI